MSNDFIRATIHVITQSYLMTIMWLSAIVMIFTLLPGWSAHSISSGSMEPSIMVGDAVISYQTHERVNPKSVITFVSAEGKLTTHRVVNVNDNGEYVTKGDANEQEDSETVSPENVVGEGRILVPRVGFIKPYIANGEWEKLSRIFIATTAAFLFMNAYTNPDQEKKSSDKSTKGKTRIATSTKRNSTKTIYCQKKRLAEMLRVK